MISTVTVRGQTAIPVVIRRKYNIKPQSKLEWVDDGYTITILPIPQNPIKALKGHWGGPSLTKTLLKAREEDKRRG